MKALVLSGGGAKGAYQVGFIKALDENQIKIDTIVGTSAGALNGALYVQSGYQALESLWSKMDFEHIFKDLKNISFEDDDFINQSNLILSFFKKTIENKGVDVTPFYQFVEELLDENKLKQSSINFGLCMVEYPSLKPYYLYKHEMKDIYHTLLASSACFPIFPMIQIEENWYIDGGYYDNLPVDMLEVEKYDEIIICDMHQTPQHPFYIDKPGFTYHLCFHDLGTFMNFDIKQKERNIRLGYLDGLKLLGKLVGHKYTFEKFESDLYINVYKEIIKKEIETHKRFNMEGSPLIEKLKENYIKPMQIEDYTYCILDYLGDIFELDETKIYSIPKFLDEVLKLIKSKKHFSVNSIQIILTMYKSASLLDNLSITKKELLVCILLKVYENIGNK